MSTIATLRGARRLEVATPAIAPLAKGARPRLIDDGLAHYEASIAGYAERYRRGETPQTLHVWWARRPHSAMRALLFGALSLDRSADALDLMRDLSRHPVPPPQLLDTARAALRNGGRRPRVLDVFGGGGTIPFEGATLGLDVHAVDSNQLAVFIQKTLLVYARGYGRETKTPIGDVLKTVGTRVLDRLTTATAPLYPDRDKGVTTYLWTYSTECERCGYRFMLSKRPWLSRKKGRELALTVRHPKTGPRMKIVFQPGPDALGTSWAGRNGTVECPSCSHLQKASLLTSRDELIADVRPGKAGKTFSLAEADSLPPTKLMLQHQKRLLRSLDMSLPATELPLWSGIVNPAVYGMKTHADVFNLRQRVVALHLIAILRDEFERAAREYGRPEAVAVIALLSGLIDQTVDWNCRLSMWISQNEQVGRAFCGPGIAMLWDYAETDPTSAGPANLRKKLDRILAGVQPLEHVDGPCTVHHSYAQALPFDDGYFDAIVTDPPYYDNLYYNVLADFFYAWKKPLLSILDPDLFSSECTDSSRELVASTFRSGSATAAHEQYCGELGLALREAARVLTPDGIFALMYSHSSLLGWAALIRAYRVSPLSISSVQPLSIERKQRPRAMTSDAVNTCVVFVARKVKAPRVPMSIGELCSRMKPVVESLHDSLTAAGWSDADIGVAAYAHGVAMLANAAGVTGGVGVASGASATTDIDALVSLEALVRTRCPEFRIKSRKSL